MQKLLIRYKTARAELDTPPNSVAQIMECDEARMQLIRALDAPYDISHEALVERAMRRIAAEAPPTLLDLPRLIKKYEAAYIADHKKRMDSPGVYFPEPRVLAQLRESIAMQKGSYADADALIKESSARVSAELARDLAERKDALKAPPISEIDDYSDMKPLHVSSLTWAVAIVAFIVIWSLAIYGGYRLVMEWIL